MKRALLIIFVTGFILCASNCKYKTIRNELADFVIKNATIYTVNTARSWEQALAILDGRLVYVGTDKGADAFIGSQTRVVDLKERLLLPGFHDSHVHLVDGGIKLGLCNLSGIESVDHILSRIRSYVIANSDKKWIIGSGWDQTLFPQANPSKDLLETVVSDRPALLFSRDGYSAWVNSHALEIAGITAKTPDPFGGIIEHNPKTGEPTGTLRGEAINIVKQYIPETTKQEYRDGLLRSLEKANSFGIISLQDAKADPEYIEAYSVLEREGILSARVRLALPYDPVKNNEEQIQELLEIHQSYQGPRINAGTIKLFLDGVFDNKSVALLEPYIGMSINDSNAYGLLKFEEKRLNHLVSRLDSMGFQVHMHAIGDRAIRIGLNAVEYTRRTNGYNDLRHNITHLHLTHPSDIPRFHQLGVVANFQPFFPGVYDYHIEIVAPLVGSKRFKYLYPIRSIMDNGAVVAAGSDWPVTTLNPLDAIEVAVTRQAIGEKNSPALNPEQRVDLARIIAAYTIAGAYVNFEEQESGSIEVGKWADFIVLDKNIFEIPVYEIHTAKVLWTVLEGREVFRAENWK
jgi:predicted amidohydrolase YtcJ